MITQLLDSLHDLNLCRKYYTGSDKFTIDAKNKFEQLLNNYIKEQVLQTLKEINDQNQSNSTI
jgi:hypothetical protein